MVLHYTALFIASSQILTFLASIQLYKFLAGEKKGARLVFIVTFAFLQLIFISIWYSYALCFESVLLALNIIGVIGIPVTTLLLLFCFHVNAANISRKRVTLAIILLTGLSFLSIPTLYWAKYSYLGVALAFTLILIMSGAWLIQRKNPEAIQQKHITLLAFLTYISCYAAYIGTSLQAHMISVDCGI